MNKRIIRTSICIVSAFAIICSSNHPTAYSAITCQETEMAGISFALDNYLSATLPKGEAANPEAIVGFDTVDIKATNDAQDIQPMDAQEAKNEAEKAIQNALNETLAGEDVSSEGATSGAAIEEETPADSTPSVAPTTTPKPVSKFADIGISKASEYVNVRTKPTTDGEVVGKLYRGCAAAILERTKQADGQWVKIKSGKVKGYIKSEYLAIGFSAEDMVDKYGEKWGIVNFTTVNVREKATTKSKILTMVPITEKLEIVKEYEEWVKVRLDETTKGFISKEYIDIEVEFDKAISIEEEEKQKKEEEAAKKAEEAQEAALKAEQQRITQQKEEAARKAAEEAKKAASKKSSSKKAESSKPKKQATIKEDKSSKQTISSSSSGSGNGSSIANFATNFVGRPYRYGGTSLTNGADCSGFVQSVYSKFGISLPRTSGSQSGCGKSVSVSQAKAGDLIFYGGGGSISHVAICIGGGKIVHASTRRTGIIISNINHRTPVCAKRIVD